MRLKVSTLVVTAVATLAALGAGIAAAWGPIEVAVPRAEVQRRVDEWLPLSGTRGPLTYELISSSPC